MRSILSLPSSLLHWHRSDRALYSLSVMIFFWAIFDGVLGYLVPLVITDTGLSKTVMGIIFGSSSIFGAIFDFLLSKYLRNGTFKRLFLLMFIICCIYPMVLWHARTVPIFLVAMALWGLYYDLTNFGIFDFVGRRQNEDAHAKEFGVISVFKALGYLLAPIFAGLLIGEIIGWQPFIFSWVLLGLAAAFFLLLLSTTKGQFTKGEERKKSVYFLREFRIWRSIGKRIIPVLLLTVILNVLDAFFWTIGPLLAESFNMLHPLNGLFLAVYSLPALFMGWGIVKLTSKFGKKKTAFFSFLLGSIILTLFFKMTNPFILMGLIFLAAVFFEISWPAIDSAYADYISESDLYEKDIEGLEDFATNIGYIIGPMLAGFLADKAGNVGAFSLLGIGGIIISLILLRVTPKHIAMPQRA